MLRKLILLAITSGLVKRIYLAYKAQKAKPGAPERSVRQRTHGGIHKV